MQEIWKDIEGFEGLYKISETGKVWSIPRVGYRNRKIGGKYVTPKTNNRGYWQIRLNRDGVTYNFLVHRLVAQTFIPNPDNLPQVNHKDENSSNNHYSNLEWCTNLYNRHYGTGYERSVKNHDYQEINARRQKAVVQMDANGAIIQQFPCAKEAAAQTRGCRRSITATCQGTNKTSGGFLWMYADEYEKTHSVV